MNCLKCLHHLLLTVADDDMAVTGADASFFKTAYSALSGLMFMEPTVGVWNDCPFIISTIIDAAMTGYYGDIARKLRQNNNGRPKGDRLDFNRFLPSIINRRSIVSNDYSRSWAYGTA